MKWQMLQPLSGAMMVSLTNLKHSPEYILSYPGLDKKNEMQPHKWYSDRPRYEFQRGMFDDPYSDDGLPDNLPQEELDLVCAVPVCAGLSTATVKPSSDATQNNNQLFLLRYALQYLRPKVYVYENAPALTTNIGEKLRKTLIEEQKKHGYLAQFIKTDARQHGVPQRRPRSYAVFWKDFAQLPKWELEHKKTPNIIGFLEKQLFEDKNYMQDCVNPNLFEDWTLKFCTEKYDDYWRMIAMNSTQDLSVFLVTHDPYYGEFLTYLTDNNAPTKYIDKVKRARAKIDAGKNFYSFGPLVLNDDFVPAIIFKTTAAMVHPIHNRSFTYREIMTLQGYPKKLDWPEELLKDFPQMIGQNAAPIQTCDWIFRNCLRIIEMNEHVRMRESPGELIVDNTKVPKTQGFHFGSS